MKKTLTLYFSLFIISSLLISCSNSSHQSNKNSASANDPLTEHIDTTVNPANDFFSFANGKWFKENPIPASESSNGIFLDVQDSVNNAVKEICEKSSQNNNATKGSNQQKIGDLYFTGMDTATINKVGITPLLPEFAVIDKINDIKSLLAEVASLNKLGVSSLFEFDVEQDQMISSKMAVMITQSGLGLPDRDYYTNTDTRTLDVKNAYILHVQKMLELAGDKPEQAKLNCQKILKIETELARASRKMEALRDPFKNFNKMTVAAANKLTPAIEWNAMCKNLGIASIDTIVIGQPEFLTSLNVILKKTSIDDWKIYLKWNLLNTYANYVNKEFELEDFLFYEQKLTGAKEQKPRWKKVVNVTDAALGELVGQEYVANYIPPNTKEKLLEIGNNIMEVYRERIKKCDWMSEPTKQKALVKLGTVQMKIGYPDKWKDYSALQINRESFVANIMRVKEWNFNKLIAKFGKPTDRTEWHMTPQMYNAYYNANSNEIVIPACNIIVPGYGKEMPEDAVLYGIVGGSTFGHEITHGFDDEGSLYDENGNLHDWWTKEDRANFKKRTQLLVNQFDGYVMLDSLHLRGLNTLGENLADLGGVLMGYEAFKKTKQGQSSEKKNGYTPNQRYFLSYAFAWLNQRRNEEIAKRIMTDVHSPAQYRVNGPLSDISEFYKAFNVKEGDAMYRADSVRVKIW